MSKKSKSKSKQSPGTTFHVEKISEPVFSASVPSILIAIMIMVVIFAFSVVLALALS